MHSPQQSIVRIDFGRFSIIDTAQAIHTTENDRANELLLRPAVFHKATRQMIEQFRMRRRFATHSKVIDRAYQTFAEQLLPNSIHHHTSRQRILLIDQPFGQLKSPTLSVRDLRKRLPGCNSQRTSRHDPIWRIRIATNINRHIGWVVAVMHRKGFRHFRTEELGMLNLRTEFFQLLGQFVALLGQ